MHREGIGFNVILGFICDGQKSFPYIDFPMSVHSTVWNGYNSDLKKWLLATVNSSFKTVLTMKFYCFKDSFVRIAFVFFAEQPGREIV